MKDCEGTRGTARTHEPRSLPAVGLWRQIDEYASLLARFEVPADFVSLVVYLFSEVLDGRNARLTDGVERALGRAPRDFRDYARAAASTGVWRSRS